MKILMSNEFESLNEVYDLWMKDTMSIFGVIYFAEDISKYYKSNFNDILLRYCKLLLEIHCKNIVLY